MKNLSLLLILAITIGSCSVTKRKHLGGYYVTWNKKDIVDKKASELKVTNGSLEKQYEVAQPSISNLAENTIEINKAKAEEQIDSSNNTTSSCDVILLQDGNELKGKVVAITLEEVQYKLCGNLEGPTISISKDDVFMVTYANGTKQKIEKSNKKQETPNTITEKKTSGNSTASLVLGILSLLVPFSIPLAIIGWVQGNIGLRKFKEQPDKYNRSTRSMAMAGKTLSIITLSIWVILLAIVIPNIGRI